MEKQVIFRDYQKAQTSDFNNEQDYVRTSFDDLVGDAVTASLRYAGFNTVKSNTAEITVAAGRFYGANANNKVGAVFTLPTQTIISVVQYLAVSQVTQRILTLVAYGVENQVDVETRDFLTNTQTLQTQPQAVAMTDSRDAVLAIVAGAESGTPQAPALNVGQVAIANILIDANGVISVTMLPAGQVTSTESLNTRMLVVEDFDAQIGPRVTALASDLAALQAQIELVTSRTLIVAMMQDIAELKVLAALPASYSFYGASVFLWPDVAQFDINNTLSLGYNALIENGVRFPSSNANQFALAMFNPIDPNASYNAGSGLLLPAFTSVLKLKTGAVASTIAIGQYSYQTFGMKKIDIPYMRLRAGATYWTCTNGWAGQNTPDTSTPAWWLPNFTTYELSDVSVTTSNNGHRVDYVDQYWLDQWTEPYWVLDATNQSITGALMAQSFLVSSDTWITKIGIWLSTVASATDVNIVLCQCTNGQPDLNKVLASGVLGGNQIFAGQMNYLTINPTYAQKGMRLAVVIVSAANHQIGMAAAGSYLDGTFFYSIDGAYFLGDFTKEIVLEIWGAKFQTNQVAIQVTSLNLAGGIRNIDLTVRAQIPASCQLIWEVQPDGTGTWLPITPDNPGVPFQNAPVLCAFRARFIGSIDIMPGVVLPNSICKIWVPAATFTYVSIVETLAAPTTSISVKIRVEHFDLTAHSLDASHGDLGGYIALYYGGPPKTRHNWASLTYTLVDPDKKSYELLATFSGIPSTNNFVLVVHGTTNSVSNVFHLASAIWWE